MTSLRLLFVMLLTLTVSAEVWAEDGEATITFSEAGLSNQQSVNGTSFALGDYFTVTYAKNGSSTNPTYYTSGTAIRCYVTKSTSNGNTITINQTENGKDVNAYITSVTYSGTNKQGTTSFAYSGTPTSSSNYYVAYSDASKITSVVATLKETGGSKNGQFYSTGITITYTYTAGGGDPADPYTVTLVPGSGSVTDTELEEPSAGEGVTLPTPTLDCGDWEFAGWKTTSAVTTETTTKPTLIPAGAYSPTSDITLYAVYQRTETTSGGGGGGVATGTISFASTAQRTSISADTQVWVNEGITFTNNKGSGSNVADYSNPIRLYKNSEIVISAPDNIDQIVFTASSSDYATALATSVGNEATCSSSTVTVTPTTGATSYTITLSAGQTRLKSLTVTYTSGGGSSSTTYYHSTPDCGDPCDALQAPNVTATATDNSITLSWEAVDGATSYNVFNYTTEELDETTNLTYTFDGLEPDTEYEWEVEAVSATCDGKGTTGTTTTLKTYTITWKNADGTVLETDKNVPYGTTPTYDGETPTQAATEQYTYTFSGWSPDVYAADKDQIYTAQFDETTRQYTVTFNANGYGTAPDQQSIAYGTKVTEPSAPTAFGYTFGGWYKEAGCTNVWDFATDVVTDNITLYAKWTAKALVRYRTDCDACIPLTGNAYIEGTYHFFPGETITMTVTPPEDVVPYTYQWQKLVVSEWDDLEGATTTTYTKTEATIEDVGHYRCVVSAEGYCDAIAEYNVKCLQLNVYYDDHTLAFTTPLEKVDATTAIKSVNLENANYKYYFEITDGCENFYGFNGDIHSGWYENVELNAMNSSTHCGLQTTKFGTYLFTVDHSYLTDDNKSYPVVTVTYPSALQEANKVIYLDNHVLDWTNSDNAEGKNKIYYRIGNKDYNSKTAMTLVPGTANLYKVTTSEYNNFEVWHIANNGCWSEGNPIYKTNTGDDWAATQATAFETLPVTLESVTVTPTTSIGNGGEDRNSNCEFFNYDITEGMKTWNAKIEEPSHGTITVKYTHHDGTAVNDFTSGNCDLAHTCLLTITATPNVGYSLTSLTVNDRPFSSGDVHTLTKNAVIKAEFTINTHTVTWKLNGGNIGGDESDIEQTYEYGAVIEAPDKPTYDCHEFLEWEPTYTAGMTTMPDEDLEFTAQWNKLSYTITFKNYDGTVLQTSTVECGETPSYTGATPTREQTAQYTYTFSGWSPTIAPATQDQEYTAQFNQTTRPYTVIWYDGTGNAHKTQTAGYNATVALPTTNPEPCDDEYPHFIGWTADPITGPTTTQPELVENVKVTGDCDYYPVFAKGEGGSSDYQKVTSALDDWSGEYLIVYETGKVAFDGGLSTLDVASNTIDVTISDNTIESTSTTDAAIFTIAAVSGGYTIKSASGYYIGRTADSNGLTSSNSTAYTNTISYSSSTISIKGSGNGASTTLKYNATSDQNRFRYYKSGQQAIALYKKGSGVNYTSYITTCCTSWTAPTLTYTTPLNAETSQTAEPQLGSGTTYGKPTYTSSNPSVLAVDEEMGVVTAIGKGTATITVTWEGNEPYCSMSATSNTITVNGSYSVTFHSNGGTGTMEPQKADPSTQRIAKLNKNEFTKAGYVFVGWKDASGVAYTDEQENITLTKNITLFAQWAPVVTLNDAGDVTTTHPTTINGTITLPNGANACDPYEFVGWTAVAIGDWNEGINEPALVATTYTPNAPTTLYAVYKIQSEGNANAFKLSFEGGNGKTYYVGSYNSSPYLRGYSNITKEEAVTFIRTKMYPDNDTKYYIYMEHKGEYLYYNGTFNSTSSTPDENQGWVFHTVGDKIKLQSTYSYDPDYLSFSDRDQETINISTSASGSEFNMLPAVTSTYVAAPLCDQEITITFVTGNGDFVANAPATNPLTVSRGDVITLPTCEYPGYEFMGWLKDEQQEEPSDIIGTYYTGDYTVDGVSSTITFYAYYKAIPEEVEFTGKDDVELLMYYYDGTANYYYAVSHAAERGELSSKQNCFNATTWTFTNVGNMQYHIQDETGKYLGAYSDGDNDLILSATPKVWTFTEVNGLWKMVCENSPSRALMYISTGKKFTNAAISMEGNGAYSYITLGICPYPTYTTNPVLSQGFSITNTAMVTSASGQKVKATSALTLETRNLELPCTFTIAAPNITFYDNTGAEVTQLTASAASEQFELHFAYKPTAENTMEYPTITITDDEHKTYTIKNRIYARSLPATFAIVAKVGNMWYALPSQGLNSTDALVGYPVEVDNQNDPTAVTAVPENADWSLRQVYASSGSNDRFKLNGANIMFENNASPAKMLNASISDNYLLTNAEYDSYKQSDNQGLYEWTPTTTDLETYTLTNAGRTDKKLNVSVNTVFGVHAQNVATNNLRFLPIDDRYTPLALQVVEWKENSIVVMYNGDPAQTASVSVNGGEAQPTTLSAAQRDIAVYELTATGLAANPTQRLSITIGTEKLLLPIPYIVNSNTTDATLTSNNKTLAAVSDLVVLNGKTFTADAATASKYIFRNVTIYGGGKLVIPADKGIGVNTLTMRLGTVNDDGSYTNSYPQLVLNGTINTGNINVDYLTTYDRYYALSLPYEVNTTSILYPADIYGDNLKDGGNNASFALQYYDGAARALNGKGWQDLDEPADLVAYKGYTFWGAPRKVKVNGATEGTRQKYGIHRIPITKTASDLMKGEKSLDDNGNVVTRTIDINAYPAESTYDMGWNFIGNPFLAAYGKMQDEDAPLELGMLVMGESGWERQGTIRYITTTEDGKYYIQTPVTDVTLYPFNTFFVQAAQEGAISFNVSNRLSLPARQLIAEQQAAKEITTGIILTGNDQTDRTGLLIADNFTEEYDFNADLSKFENSGINLYTIGKDGKLAFMAINQALAEQPIPLGYGAPADGEYTIAFDEDRYNATDISALYLIDYDRNETTNLLHTDYSFVTAAGTNNERFALQVAFIPQNATSVEWVDDATIQVAVDGNSLLLNNLPTDAGVQVFDALGRVIYATPNAPTEMQITLPTGYYLVRIADKQHAVVINTIIP